MAKLSIQLYTLREESKTDFEGVLKFCAEQGFEGVEFAGFYDQTKETIKEWLTKYNLTATSAHIPFEEMEKDMDAVMEFQKYIGNTRLVIPYYDAKDAATTQELIEKLKPVVEKANANGFSIYYHNHAHEIQAFDGTCAMKILSENFTPEQLKFEVDTFWVYAGGEVAVDFLDTYADRIDGIVHIKDGFDATCCNEDQKAMLPKEAYERMEDGINMCPCSIGLGNAPVVDVINKCKEMNLTWLVLENDFPHPTGFEDVARSIKVLKDLVG